MARQAIITFARSALNDLEEVLEYYREQQIRQVGEKLVAKVIQDVELLGEQPRMGRVVPEFELDHLRELVRPPFRIVCRLDKDRVRIVRIWRRERLLLLP